MYAAHIMYGASTFAAPRAVTNVSNSFAAGGPGGRDAHVFYVRSTHNVRGEHICRAESRTSVRNSFSAGGPESRDAHMFYVRTTHNVRGEHICRAESRTNVRNSFSTGGPPASRDAHVFFL